MADDTLYIDADEEITSVIDKLKESEARTVLLVIPKGANLLQSVVNLKLLRKKADELGKNIAFVTSDQVGRNLSAQVGIPVYEDTEGRRPVAQTGEPARPPTEETIEVDMSAASRDQSPVNVHYYRPESGKVDQRAVPPILVRSTGARRKVLLGLGLFVLAASTILYLYPKTTVVIGVQSVPFDETIDLTIDRTVQEVARNSSILPGTEIAVEQEKTTTATATGRRTVGETAKGAVTIYNCYQSVPLTLASGRTLTSGGKEFVTTAEVTVPAATIVGSCTTAGTANVNIEAKAVGADSNLADNSTFCVSGYDCSGATYVNARNNTALQGGSSREVRILTQQDIDAAAEQGSAGLLAEASEAVKTEAESRNLRILDAAVDRQVLETRSDRAAGTETNDSQVTTKVRVRTLAFSEQHYRELIVNLLSLRIETGKKLILSERDEISTGVVEANWEQGFVKIRGQVQTRVADDIPDGEIKSLVRNRSLGAAEAALYQLPSVVEVSVDTVPRFINRTALVARNITVRVEAK
jgi:hypothetical protein